MAVRVGRRTSFSLVYFPKAHKNKQAFVAFDLAGWSFENLIWYFIV